MIEFSSQQIELISKSLIEWFKLYGRKFPWRIEKKKYKILVTEFLLQRTKAESVNNLYNEFFQVYPTLKSLANSNPITLNNFFLRIGLMYRAKRLKEITNSIVNNYNGEIPCNFSDLLRLKGIGVYIASATLNFGCNIPTPTVDKNVIRVLNRIAGIINEFDAREFIQKMYEYGDHKKIAYSLIDLGSLICIDEPLCDKCCIFDTCPKYDLKKSEWKLLRKVINKKGEIKLREN